MQIYENSRNFSIVKIWIRMRFGRCYLAYLHLAMHSCQLFCCLPLDQSLSNSVFGCQRSLVIVVLYPYTLVTYICAYLYSLIWLNFEIWTVVELKGLMNWVYRFGMGVFQEPTYSETTGSANGSQLINYLMLAYWMRSTILDTCMRVSVSIRSFST